VTFHSTQNAASDYCQRLRALVQDKDGLLVHQVWADGKVRAAFIGKGDVLRSVGETACNSRLFSQMPSDARRADLVAYLYTFGSCSISLPPASLSHALSLSRPLSPPFAPSLSLSLAPSVLPSLSLSLSLSLYLSLAISFSHSHSVFHVPDPRPPPHPPSIARPLSPLSLTPPVPPPSRVSVPSSLLIARPTPPPQ